jgi:hypothetical protein
MTPSDSNADSNLSGRCNSSVNNPLISCAAVTAVKESTLDKCAKLPPCRS